MKSERRYDWTNKNVFEGLRRRNNPDCDEYVVESVDGAKDSVVVSMYAADDEPIAVMMNGEEILAEVVLFSLDRNELRNGDAII